MEQGKNFLRQLSDTINKVNHSLNIIKNGFLLNILLMVTIMALVISKSDILVILGLGGLMVGYNVGMYIYFNGINVIMKSISTMLISVITTAEANLKLIQDQSKLLSELRYPSETQSGQEITVQKPLREMTIEELESLIEWATGIEEYRFAETVKKEILKRK